MLYVKLLVLLYLQNMRILYLAIYHIQYTYIQYMSQETVLKTCIHMPRWIASKARISFYLFLKSAFRLIYTVLVNYLLQYFDENKGEAV
jgi:hypothetical protein